MALDRPEFNQSNPPKTEKSRRSPTQPVGQPNPWNLCARACLHGRGSACFCVCFPAEVGVTGRRRTRRRPPAGPAVVDRPGGGRLQSPSASASAASAASRLRRVGRPTNGATHRPAVVLSHQEVQGDISATRCRPSHLTL